MLYIFDEWQSLKTRSNSVTYLKLAQKGFARTEPLNEEYNKDK